MALYKYDGPFDEVEVRVAGEFVGLVEKGGSIAIDDDVAANVSFGDDWSKVKPRSNRDKEKEKEAPKIESVPSNDGDDTKENE